MLPFALYAALVIGAVDPIVVPDITVQGSESTTTDSGSTSEIDLTTHQGQGQTVAEALKATPGVSLLRLGARGNSVDVRIRSLGGSHVGIVIDGVPMLNTGLQQFDLSLLPADGIASIYVGRGTGPLHLPMPIGGVLEINTVLPTGRFKYGLNTGFGTQLSRSAGGFIELPWKKGGVRVSTAYQGTQGNFTFYDDQTTRYNASDDVIRTRQNNHSDRLVLHTRVYQPFKHAALHITTLTALDARGIPGPSYAETLHTSSKSIFQSARISASDVTIGRMLRLNLGVDAMVNGRSFSDPERETTLGIQDHRAWLVQAGADQRADITLKHVDLAIAGRTDGAWFHSAQDSATQNNGRLQTQWGLQSVWRAHRTTSLDATLQAGHLNEFSASNTSHWAFSPQGGVRVQTGPCSTRAHAGLFHRFASLAERFGDSAMVLENKNIKPERGWNADAGTMCKIQTQRFGRYTLDAATFFIDATELVRLLQVSRQAYRYENLGKTRATGVELATHLAPWSWIDLRVGYTFTHAVNRSEVLGEQGKPAATIPPHLVHSALVLKHRGASVSYGVTYRSQTTLDRAGLLIIPDRTQHDLAVRLPFAQEWAITMELLNITGVISHPAASGTAPEALKDVVGYPWPGRTAFVSLQWSPQ